MEEDTKNKYYTIKTVYFVYVVILLRFLKPILLLLLLFHSQFVFYCVIQGSLKKAFTHK